MSIKQLSLTALVVVSLAGCSSATHTKTSAPASTTTASTSAPSTTPTSSAAPTSATPVAGGGASDFCSAYKEYKDAVQADTPQAQGAGFRAAATDLHTFAPAAIKQAAGLFADVIDEVGQGLEAGKPNPETLGAGQSAERRQAIADSITWITSNCH